MVLSISWLYLSIRFTKEDLPTVGLLALVVAIVVIVVAGIMNRLTSKPIHRSPTGRRPKPVKQKLPHRGYRIKRRSKPKPRTHDRKTPRPKRR